MKDLLIEIGTEELPARVIQNAKEAFLASLQEAFSSKRIGFEKSIAFATPRRIAALIYKVASKQEETVVLKYGPPVNIAYDDSGNPLPAAIGFAKSCGVQIEELKRVKKNDVYVLACEKKEGGKRTEDILPEIIKDALEKIPFPKKMRWGFGSFEFARPIRWLLILFGEKVIGMRIADVESGSITYGHRFLARGPISIETPSQYLSKLKEAYVIVDEKERKKMIMEGLERIEEETGAKAFYDETIIDEILYLTEYPYALKGTFDPSYLSLPEPILINVMTSNQRCIPLLKKDGTLLPYFIFFSNIIPKDEKVIVKGNEKVLKARFDDAKFYFEEDRKTNLFDLYEKLENITYHEKIGNMKQKAKRIEGLAEYLNFYLNYENSAKIHRTAKLLKADLATRMVAEFPELQGKMGRIYAQLSGEEEDVCLAIEEHYYPISSESKLPSANLGTIFSLADKIDTLVSFFSCGITPTGNLDPYGLRRCAIGFVRTVVEKKIHILLPELIAHAYEEGKSIKNRLPLDLVRTQVIDFVVTRFKFLMTERGYEQDLVESVIPQASIDIYDGYLRLSYLKEIKDNPEFERLLIGFKRVFNITKKVDVEGEVKRELFEKEEEERLFSIYTEKREPYVSHLANKRYRDALFLLMELKDPIDAFFDKVFVMVEDEAIRTNRLTLLKGIKDMFILYCDFQKIRSE